MATLPELVSTPVTIAIKGHEFTAKPLTLLSLAEVYSDIEKIRETKSASYANILNTIRFVKAFVLKTVDTEEDRLKVTDEYIAELINGLASESIKDLLTNIGAIDPKVPPTGGDSSPESATEPAGVPTPSQA